MTIVDFEYAQILQAYNSGIISEEQKDKLIEDIGPELFDNIGLES